jgi:hypothetical protein
VYIRCKSPRRAAQALLAACEGRAHEGLTELLREHAFVGCVTERLALVQV